MNSAVKLKNLQVLGLVLVIGLAAYLRFIAVAETRIDAPIRGDARLYVIYALNLQHFGVFSREIPKSEDVAPKPDAFVTPGYPTFLAALLDQDNIERSIAVIGYVQALLGTLTVLIYFILFSRFLSPTFSLLGTLLVAISPHLVNASVYLLTETLFTFMLGATLLSLDIALRGGRARLFALTGLLLGATTLVRPTTLLFLLAIAFLLTLIRQKPAANLRNFLIMCVAFSVIQGGWMMRNLHATGAVSDPSLTASFIQHGSYPNLMYENRPETYGYPYDFDPYNEQIRGNLKLVLSSLWIKAKEDPGEYLAWFLYGKPVQYFSWSLTESVGDSFIYAPLKTPYADNAVLSLSYQLSKIMHWPSITLAAGSLVLLTMHRRRADVAALLLAVGALYFVGLHMIGAPFPRYSLPIRPVAYGLSIVSLQWLWFTMNHLSPFQARRDESPQPDSSNIRKSSEH
jgi:hypothetical protein